jgi:hypothetical protein
MGKNTQRDSLMERHEEAAQKAAKGEITSDYLRLQSYAPSYQGKRDTYENTLKALQEADTDLMREEKKSARAKGMKKGNSGGADSDGMKKGGSVSSASKRADGCAMRGKTKGRMV